MPRDDIQVGEVLRSDIKLRLAAGELPEQYEPVRKVDAGELLSAADWIEMAQRWERHSYEAMQKGNAEDAAQYASAAAEFYRLGQLAGGRPEDV